MSHQYDLLKGAPAALDVNILALIMWLTSWGKMPSQLENKHIYTVFLATETSGIFGLQWQQAKNNKHLLDLLMP